MNDSIIIEPDTFGSENNYIQEISFSEKSCQAQCIIQDTEKAVRLKQRIYALRGIWDTDVVSAERRQNFEVELDGKRVVLSGNLSNAFYLMKENKLITSALFKSVNEHPEIATMLEKSKFYIAKDEVTAKISAPEGNLIPQRSRQCNIL